MTVKDVAVENISSTPRLSPRRSPNKNVEQELAEIMSNIELNKPSARTCLSSDEKMMLHENLLDKYLPIKSSKIKHLAFIFFPI